MLKHFHMTRRQWLGLLKWTLYAVTLLLTIVFQSVILSRLAIFGVRLHVVPLLLCCVCIREGPEKGGLFVLLGSLFWSLSGVDYGNLSILIVTVCAVLSAQLCTTVLANRFPAAALCCFVTTLLNELAIFAFKLILTDLAVSNLWRVLLPCVGLSMLGLPLLYLLVKAISRIGGDHGV